MRVMFVGRRERREQSERAGNYVGHVRERSQSTLARKYFLLQACNHHHHLQGTLEDNFVQDAYK